MAGERETQRRKVRSRDAEVQETEARGDGTDIAADLAGAGRATVRPLLATSVVAAIILLIAAVSIWIG